MNGVQSLFWPNKAATAMGLRSSQDTRRMYAFGNGHGYCAFNSSSAIPPPSLSLSFKNLMTLLMFLLSRLYSSNGQPENSHKYIKHYTSETEEFYFNLFNYRDK